MNKFLGWNSFMFKGLTVLYNDCAVTKLYIKMTLVSRTMCESISYKYLLKPVGSKLNTLCRNGNFACSDE